MGEARQKVPFWNNSFKDREERKHLMLSIFNQRLLKRKAKTARFYLSTEMST